MDIPTMIETRREIIILDECVEVRLWGPTVKYYNSLGYKGKQGDIIDVSIDDLPIKSNAKVLVMCPACEEQRMLGFDNIAKNGHTLCRRCSASSDLEGMTFGRWKVMEFYPTSSPHSHWVCQCECGEIRVVKADSLISGASVSCGCYRLDVMSSWACDNAPNWRGGKQLLHCKNCNEPYYVHRYRSFSSDFCSHKCKWEWRSKNIIGEVHPNWNPELTNEERIVGRNYPEYRQYIQDVLYRDNYTCQICGSTEDLQVHHMYSHKHYPEYRLAVEWGLTMCRPDHDAFHRWNGGNRNKCTPDDLDRWLYEVS